MLAERLAHTLKGVAGNIGATDVHAAAGVLEKSIRDRDPAPEFDVATARVAAVLDPLVARLRAVLPQSGVSAPLPPVATASPAESRDAATRLVAMLADSDPSAADFVETHASALRALFGPGGWPEFETMVREYAFDDAREQLQTALESLIPDP